MKEKYFYNHFTRDKATRIGGWFIKKFSENIFHYSGLKKGDSVLEIGPGKGVFAGVCLKSELQYYAVEANEQMADAIEKKGGSVTRAKVPPLPEFDREFDAVVMINVMEHMNGLNDALQISQQIRDTLKPGGKFIICSPDYLSYRQNFFNCDFSHNYVTTRRRLKQLLISSGFDKIKGCYLSGPLKGVSGIVVAAFIALMPFGYLNAMFDENMIFSKLYKLQLTFSRKVLIIGEK